MVTTDFSIRTTVWTRLRTSNSRRWLCGVVYALAVLGVLLSATARVSAQLPNRSLIVYARPLVYNNPDLDSLVLVEFPFSLDRAQLDFYRPDSADPSYYARVFAQVVLIDNQGRSADSSNTYFSARVGNIKEVTKSSQMLFNKLQILAHPGSYSARFSVIDAVSKRSAEAVIPGIEVHLAGTTKLTLAGATLAYRLEHIDSGQTAANERMVRNQYMILNSPIGVFTHKDSAAYLYAELYNLSAGGQDSAAYYRVAYSASNLATGAYHDLGKRKRLKGGRSAVMADVFDIRGWPIGKYELKAVVTDLGNRAIDSVSLALAIVDPLAIIPGDEVSRLFDPYDSLTLQERVHLVAYILDPNDKATISRLNDTGKAVFLTRFWKEREANPEMFDAPSRTEMVTRYRYVNQFFSNDLMKTDGWSTDRGRIYMKYGKFDRQLDVPAPQIGNPFVIWYYYGMKEGKVFVFVDTEGTRVFKLVHSNVSGEVYSEAWAERLKDEMLDIR